MKSYNMVSHLKNLVLPVLLSLSTTAAIGDTSNQPSTTPYKFYFVKSALDAGVLQVLGCSNGTYASNIGNVTMHTTLVKGKAVNPAQETTISCEQAGDQQAMVRFTNNGSDWISLTVTDPSKVAGISFMFSAAGVDLINFKTRKFKQICHVGLFYNLQGNRQWSVATNNAAA